jgi:hypothetical protein
LWWHNFIEQRRQSRAVCWPEATQLQEVSLCLCHLRFPKVSQVWWFAPVVPALRGWGRRILSLRPAWAMQWDPVSKKKKSPQSGYLLYERQQGEGKSLSQNDCFNLFWFLAVPGFELRASLARQAFYHLSHSTSSFLW